MNKIPAFMALALMLSLCNLTDKLRSKSGGESNSSTSSSPGSGSSTSNEPVERPSPTSAQIAALEGGQTVTWDQQGITWKLPAKWTKVSVANEMFNWGGGGGFIIVSISALGDTYPMDTALQASYDGAKTSYKNGK